MIGFLSLAWGWFRGSTVGRYLAIAGGILLAAWVVYARGKSAARAEAEVDDLKGALDVHHRADEALRRADGDTRPVDERLRGHNRLRD